MANFEDLIGQVDAFIRKYYKNLIIKGFLLSLIIFSISFFTVVGLEYLARFNSIIRGILFYLFLGINIYVFVLYFIFPLTKLFSFGNRINRFQAAKIIGNFFPEVNDKLLNTLQLNATTSEFSQTNIDLVQASIEQNAKRLTVFNFPSAINYLENKRYLKYLLPLILLLLLIGYFIPTFFKEGTERLVNYNETFEVPAPFSFELLSTNLEVEAGTPTQISVKVSPNEINGELPDRIYIETTEGRFLMTKSNLNKANFTFENPSRPIQFNFYSNGFTSNTYMLNVVGKTALGELNAELIFPDYLNLPTQEIENVGDLLVPEGTIISWSGKTKNTKDLSIRSNDSVYTFTSSYFNYSSFFKNSENITFLLTNNSIDKVDSLVYAIDVIKDAYPEITVQEQRDSLSPNLINFAGFASDDHGLREITFTYEITRKDGSQLSDSKVLPGVIGTRTQISMNFNLKSLPLELDDMLTYYFTVLDNDGVNGSKANRSSMFLYKVPSTKEQEEKRTAEKENAKKDLQQLIQETKDLNDQLNSLQFDLLNTQNPSWKELKQIEQLQDQRQSLQEKIEQLKNDVENSFEENNSLSPVDEELLQKQELLEELLNDVMDDELMEMLKKLEEMLKENTKDGMKELFENAEMNAEDMNSQLDKTMEMLKRMDVDERMENIETTLDELANKQEQLKEQIQNNELSKEEALQKQKELNKSFEELNQKMEELMNKNEELKRPLDLDNMQEDREAIQKDMESASDNLEKEDEEKANEDQQNASDKMQEMSSKINAMKQKSKQKQNQEDMESLRRLLTNLLRLSFDQEQNQYEMNAISIYDPLFTQLGKQQRSIIDNFKPVEDSLRALADRLPDISTFVNDQLNSINLQYANLINDIDEREQNKLEVKQQKAMTALNNLALFLNESLQSMQQQMQGEKSGQGSCDNPGGKGQGKDGDQLQNMKELLKQQLKEMEKGQNPGGNKPGKQQGAPLPIGSKQAAQMAAQQQAMRKRLQEMKNQLNKDGKGAGNELNDLLKELEEQERNLINKKWDNELIERQQEILTRLLESEKALNERGWDDQRERQIGKDEENGNQIEFLEYKKEKERQIELLRTLDPNFSQYYRDRANEYFNSLYK